MIELGYGCDQNLIQPSPKDYLFISIDRVATPGIARSHGQNKNPIIFSTSFDVQKFRKRS